MKNILILTILPIFLTAQIVVGTLQYPNKGYDFKQGESVTFTYQNQSVNVQVEYINDNTALSLLEKIGIKPENILCARAFGSIETDEIEMMFAYKGSVPGNYSAEIKLATNYHNYFDNAYQNGFLIPWYIHIGQSADSLANAWARLAPIRTFMCRPQSSPLLPFNIIGGGVKNGGLADMRNIPNSYQLVPYFKQANWKIIWYMDSTGKQIGLFKPTTGWSASYQKKNIKKDEYIKISIDSTLKEKATNTQMVKSRIADNFMVDFEKGTTYVGSPSQLSNYQLEQLVRTLTQKVQQLEENEPQCCCDPIHQVSLFYTDFFGTGYESDPSTLNLNDRLPLDNICPGATGALLMNDATIYCRYVGLPDQWIVISPVHGGINQ